MTGEWVIRRDGAATVWLAFRDHCPRYVRNPAKAARFASPDAARRHCEPGELPELLSSALDCIAGRVVQTQTAFQR
jgi:hypothetical protein